jgi:regulator of protease activity HflC (stomatin/prohibitin superfamily)
VQQYEEGVLFRLGRVVGVKSPGPNTIVPGKAWRRRDL